MFINIKLSKERFLNTRKLMAFQSGMRQLSFLQSDMEFMSRVLLWDQLKSNTKARSIIGIFKRSFPFIDLGTCYIRDKTYKAPEKEEEEEEEEEALTNNESIQIRRGIFAYFISHESG